MTNSEVAWGTGDVFRDLDHPAVDVEQTKAILAAEIIGILDDDDLGTRKTQERTGSNHADLARIRTARLDRITIDGLLAIVDGPPGAK